MRIFLSPKWIVSHVFVLAMVVAMTGLGFWQLDRLDQRKERNDDVRLATEADPVDVEELLGSDVLDHTAVTVTGEYLGDLSFFVANRSYEGQAGSWLVTPVRLLDGRILVVSRGWVPRLWVAGEDAREIETPSGQVELRGRILASVDGGRIGTGSTSILPEISRLDLDRVEELLGIEVVDHWVQLERPAEGADDIPIPVPRPSLDEGPHLSYAFQWFFFSSATVIAYGLILRARRREHDIAE